MRIRILKRFQWYSHTHHHIRIKFVTPDERPLGLDPVKEKSVRGYMKAINLQILNIGQAQFETGIAVSDVNLNPESVTKHKSMRDVA